SQAEERSRAPFGGNRGGCRHCFADIVAKPHEPDPLGLDERSPACRQRVKTPAFHLAKPCFGNRAPAADLWGVVTVGARCVVENRTQSLHHTLIRQEFGLASEKLGSLRRIEARQRVTKVRLRTCANCRK